MHGRKWYNMVGLGVDAATIATMVKGPIFETCVQMTTTKNQSQEVLPPALHSSYAVKHLIDQAINVDKLLLKRSKFQFNIHRQSTTLKKRVASL